MTISSETRKAGPYICNGVTTEFSFNFKCFSTADVRVVLTNSASVESDLVLNSTYTVLLNADQNALPGGVVTTTATYATGFKITLVGDVDYLQGTDITNGGGFYPEVFESALDKLAIQVQQVREIALRAVKVDVSSTSDPSALLAEITQSVADAAESAYSAGESALDASNSMADARTYALEAADSALSVAPINQQILAASAITSPASADEMAITASGSGHALRSITWLALKDALATYFTTLFAAKGSNSDITALTGLTGETTIKGVALLGYGTGAGGTVTQLTSKATPVTLNTPTGRITLNAASLAASTAVTFTLFNSLLSSSDTLVLSMVSSSGTTGAYVFTVTVSGATAFITVRNMTAGALAEALALNYTILKGVIA